MQTTPLRGDILTTHVRGMGLFRLPVLGSRGNMSLQQIWMRWDLLGFQCETLKTNGAVNGDRWPWQDTKESLRQRAEESSERRHREHGGHSNGSGQSSDFGDRQR